MYVDPKQTEAANLYKLLIGAITPRPIAFVSTVSKAGINRLSLIRPSRLTIGLKPIIGGLALTPVKKL